MSLHENEGLSRGVPRSGWERGLAVDLFRVAQNRCKLDAHLFLARRPEPHITESRRVFLRSRCALTKRPLCALTACVPVMNTVSRADRETSSTM